VLERPKAQARKELYRLAEAAEEAGQFMAYAGLGGKVASAEAQALYRERSNAYLIGWIAYSSKYKDDYDPLTNESFDHIHKQVKEGVDRAVWNTVIALLIVFALFPLYGLIALITW
jgi:hypothetical protein